MDHTELPWEWNWKTNGLEADCGIRHIDNSGNAHAVVRCPRYQGEQQWKADAAFIVRACNDYYNLFEALKAGYEEIDELTKQHAKLLEALKSGYPFVKAHVGALHMMDGFNPQEREEDKLLLKIEQAIAEAEEQS